MPEFEIIDHTADVGLLAYGSTRKEVFINAAAGMVSLITDPEKVNPVCQREIALDADDYEDLLVVWLNELLYLFDAENLIFSRFEITSLNHDSLSAIVQGEKIDLARHEIKTQVKAATYHQIKLNSEEEGFSARIIFDI
ncbi:MAG: archease [Dehalococcoidia bacterium]